MNNKPKPPTESLSTDKMSLDDNQSIATSSDAYTSSSFANDRLLPGLRPSQSQGKPPSFFLAKKLERTSLVWKHGTLYYGPNKNGILNDRWRCNLCKIFILVVLNLVNKKTLFNNFQVRILKLLQRMQIQQRKTLFNI